MDKIGRQIANASFLIGTLLLLLFYFSGNSEGLLLIVFSYFVLIGIVLFNLVFAIILLRKGMSDERENSPFFRALRRMLLNIPIAVLYFFIVLQLADTMRITFVNDIREEAISNIKIVGCENEIIDHLDMGESENVWIDISGDCSIFIEYKFHGKTHREEVFGYVTGGMGQRGIYHIGSEHSIDSEF
jgi:hypothetical protein